MIKCLGGGVKEGHEEREGTWERKREVEIKEWQRTVHYVHRRQFGQTEDAQAELILPFLEARVALPQAACHTCLSFMSLLYEYGGGFHSI